MPLTKYSETAIPVTLDLQERGEALAHDLSEATFQSGTPTRALADLLDGTWLGHPLRVVVTDDVIGAWVTGAAFDVAGLASRNRKSRWASDALATSGTEYALSFDDDDQIEVRPCAA